MAAPANFDNARRQLEKRSEVDNVNVRKDGPSAVSSMRWAVLDLKSGTNFLAAEQPLFAGVEPPTSDSFSEALGILRRQGLLVLLLALIGAALGIFYFMHAPPRYTANSTLLLNTQKIQFYRDPNVSQEMPAETTGAVESQIAVLRSDVIARKVIAKLGLADDPRFMSGPGGTGLGTLLRSVAPSIFGEEHAMTPLERENAALAIFDKSLGVGRVGVTYAIDISFQSRYSDLSASVANAISDAYVDLQRSSVYDVAKRTSDWLEERVPELRAKSAAAQQAVIDYKRDHNLVETATGQLIEDQRLADINQQLSVARDETLKAKNRFDQLAALSSADTVSAVLTGSKSKEVGSDLLDKLRAQYQDIASKEVDASTRLGPNNVVMVSLRNQKSELRKAIGDEIQRLKTISQTDYAMTASREAMLKKEFDGAVDQAQGAKGAQVKLQELEASAKGYQDLYRTYIDRYHDSLQQVMSPVAEARIISTASPLLKRDYKATTQIALLFLVGGLAFGVGVAFLREMFGGRVFLTSKSVQSRLHAPCLGLLPKVRLRNKRSTAGAGHMQLPGSPKTLARGDRGVGWTVIDYPFSQYSEGVRSIKLAIDLENRSKSTRVIGLTSTTPGEGKSTVALSVAQLMAHNGASVALVDCDIRNPSLTRSLAPNAKSGIVEVAFGRASLDDIVVKDAATQLAFFPAIANSGPPDPPSILSGPELRRVFDELRKQYQFVIVDLSPLAPVIDVCATTEFIDSYVFVIEWGRTTIDLVKRALRAASVVSESILGVVLNKADVKTLAKYDSYPMHYYYYKGDN